MNELKYDEWKDHWKKLFGKLEIEGYNNLTPDERTWYNVRGVIDSIGNGGIISFYYNHGADNLDDTIEDLHKLNASNIVELLKKVNQLFPIGKPSKNIDERNEVINLLNEELEFVELIETLDDKFYVLENELEHKLEEVVRRIIQQSPSDI